MVVEAVGEFWSAMDDNSPMFFPFLTFGNYNKPQHPDFLDIHSISLEVHMKLIFLVFLKSVHLHREPAYQALSR